MALDVHDVGHRVVVRRFAGERDGRPLFSDLLGELVTWGDPAIVRTADGSEVAVPLAAIASAKRVPPRAERARHRSIGVLELERVSALGWRATETAQLDGWLLRAANGWTGRANSAMPLADPGPALADDLTRIRAWYAERGLRALIQVPLPTLARLQAALLAAGWEDAWGAEVKTAGCAQLLATVPVATDLPPARFEAAPTPDWLKRYHYRGGELPAHALAVLRSGADTTFASVVEDGQIVAIARGAVDEGWLGITAVEVDPAARRRGLATHILRELAAWAAERGAHSVYLQVEDTNGAAQAVYDRAGFANHHSYRYLRAPA